MLVLVYTLCAVIFIATCTKYAIPLRVKVKTKEQLQREQEAHKRNRNSGYTMLELLLASAVGGVVIAGGYASYVIIAQQYKRIATLAEVQENGVPTMRIISRDLRMAGRTGLDTNMDLIYGAISTPIAITDSGDACCDSVVIIYDKDSTVNPKRCQITYSTATRTSPTREALYMTVSTLFSDTGDLCVGDSTTSLVTDYVEDLQFVGSDLDSSSNPRIVDVSMVIRSKNTTAKSTTFTPPSQVVGNYNYSFTDTYYRDVFTSTINIKNVRN